MKRGSKRVQFTSRKGQGSRPETSRKDVMRDENPMIFETLTDQLSTGFVLRFQTTVNWTGSLTVRYQDLLDAWFVAGTATTAYQLFDFVKIRKVVVRAMGQVNTGIPSLTPQATVGVEYPGLVGGQFGSGKQRIGSDMGTTQPAFVSLKPDRMSQAAQYQPSTSNAAFIVRAVDAIRNPLIGAVIDVHVSYKNSGDISPASVSSARAGLQPGQLYFGGLDGLAVANTVARTSFIPQG